jgi:epoxide hydrolase
MQKDPFKVSIPNETLKDLHLRLTRTRWPIDFSNSNWEYGNNGTYLKELVDYWL